MRRLSEHDFARLLEWAPLVSIDLLVTDADGRLLVGERVNEPAKGFLFVPGGKIEKDDKTLSDALSRIAAYELGVADPLQWDPARLHGAFMHRYDTNALEVRGLETVYVVLAYRLRHPDDVRVAIDQLPEAQHSSYFWIDRENLSDLPAEVHANTLVYLDEPTPSRR
jgi:colanic acid biosynthesis protein WcaH